MPVPHRLQMAAGGWQSAGSQHPCPVPHGPLPEVVEDLFYQFVRKLEGMGETDHRAVFIDGTKLESRAGRYSFVWRKNVEKQLARVKEKLKSMTGLSTCGCTLHAGGGSREDRVCQRHGSA